MLHKIILNELGVKQISVYKFEVMDIESLVAEIKSKYSFLENKSDLSKRIISILNSHHKVSFFNKPLVLLSNKSVTVGQVNNG